MSLMDITKFPIDVGIGQPEHNDEVRALMLTHLC